MAGINLFISEASAGENSSDGVAVFEICGIFAENCILCSRCVSFEKLTRAQIISILHISCGVMLGDIECFKAVVVIGDFGIIFDGKAHAEEDIFNSSLCERDGMI